MNVDAQQDRAADLLLARQFGQLYYRESNNQQIRSDFERMFKGDQEALAEFEGGAIEEDQRRMTLRMNPEQYRTYHANKRSGHGRLQSR